MAAVASNTFDAIAEEAGFRTAKSEITHETEFRPLIARLAAPRPARGQPGQADEGARRRAAAIFKAFTLRTPEGLEIGVDVEPSAPSPPRKARSPHSSPQDLAGPDAPTLRLRRLAPLAAAAVLFGTLLLWTTL